MTGEQFEQFVRAVLCSKPIGIPKRLVNPETLSETPTIRHRIDLVLRTSGNLSDYIEVIECKYRSKKPVEREVLQKLKAVIDSVNANKGIVVSNRRFSKEAEKYARHLKYRIGLHIITPTADAEKLNPIGTPTDLFEAYLELIQRKPKSFSHDTILRLCTPSQLMPVAHSKASPLFDEVLPMPGEGVFFPSTKSLKQYAAKHDVPETLFRDLWQMLLAEAQSYGVTESEECDEVWTALWDHAWVTKNKAISNSASRWLASAVESCHVSRHFDGAWYEARLHSLSSQIVAVIADRKRQAFESTNGPELPRNPDVGGIW